MSQENHNQHVSALEHLFARFYKPLRAYAFRYVNHKATSEDIVQDVFLELWVRRDSIRFDDFDAVKSYLFKSVYNHSINILKWERLHDRCTLEDMDESVVLEKYISSYMFNREQSLLFKELDAEIAGFVETLPPQCKKVFSLSRTRGLRNREIAELLNISIKAVEKQISKALTGIRNHLKAKELI
jgi:RNA polymerase sigma-70 factor (ECF subfamily)